MLLFLSDVLLNELSKHVITISVRGAALWKRVTMRYPQNEKTSVLVAIAGIYTPRGVVVNNRLWLVINSAANKLLLVLCTPTIRKVLRTRRVSVHQIPILCIVGIALYGDSLNTYEFYRREETRQWISLISELFIV